MCFLFQAEDGIRDLVRSRGLGDVYKRQELTKERLDILKDLTLDMDNFKFYLAGEKIYHYASVSYTHLSLPTSDLV